MGRRRHRREQTSPVEDIAQLIVDASGRWPIVGVVCCIAFLAWGVYLLSHPTSMFGLARLFGGFVIVAGIGCGILAAIGWRKNARAAAGPLGTPSSSSAWPQTWTAESVAALSWQQFEQLVSDLFRRRGYTVRQTGRDAQSLGVGDGGVDLVLTDPSSPGADFLVQCKQYKVWSVGEPKVREFYGAMAAWQTRCEGIVITCGRFTQPAIAFAAGKPLRLIDGDGLLRLLHEHNPIAPQVTTAAPEPVQHASLAAPSTNRHPPTPGTAATRPEVPACPKCRIAMKRRTASTGPRKGQAFWGCANYPACREIINIATT